MRAEDWDIGRHFVISFSEKFVKHGRLESFFLEKKWFGRMWIAKKDLYPSQDQVPELKNILCNHVMFDNDENETEENIVSTYFANEQRLSDAWYFDSGCS